jgi:hypothetical protein
VTTPTGKFEPIRELVETGPGELTEVERGLSYTVDGGALGLLGLLSPDQQQWVIDQLRESGELIDVDIHGGDVPSPLP